MKNKQIYVITMATGSYDSFQEIIVAVTDDFNKGESYVNKMNANYQTMEKKVQAFYKNEYVDWNNRNPRPNPKVIDLIKIPKWKGDQKITQEMRNERKVLESKNSEMARKAHEHVLQWSKDLNKFCEDWAGANLTQDEFEIYLVRDDNHWSIEEAKWL